MSGSLLETTCALLCLDVDSKKGFISGKQTQSPPSFLAFKNKGLMVLCVCE